MQNIKQTTQLVKAILEQDNRCRNSDSFLYFKVLSIVAERKGVDIDEMTVPYFLLNMHGTVFPPFESVRRSRQKVQERYPDLAACDTVAGYRAGNESAVREYARGTIL